MSRIRMTAHANGKRSDEQANGDRGSLPPTKHILPPHLESIHNLLEATEGDGLLTLLQPEEG